MKRKRRRNGRRGRHRHSRFSSGFSAKKSNDGTSDSPLQQRRRTKGEGGLHPIVSNRGTKMKQGVGSVKALSSMLDETRYFD
ncbi:hypothetical protein MRB53_036172 [Persea americana]|uniref:Uncharacterized protein n=1 Tax=Persea americana TaxID=3435 RepID=A0ACC2K6S6_PERAE|nr:hypothetical protein MRB53_036172 [Persea americana]